MAEGKHEAREFNVRTTFTWLELFRGFQIAIDPRKLLLAGAGILTMALGWWLLSVIFNTSEPKWSEYDKGKDTKAEWASYKAALADWDLRHKAAGPKITYDTVVPYGAGDLATTEEEYRHISVRVNLATDPKAKLPEDYKFPTDNLERIVGEKAAIVLEAQRAKKYVEDNKIDLSPSGPYAYMVPRYFKPSGQFRTLPWFEDRGPNPYLLVSGQSYVNTTQPSSVIDWLTTREGPVLLEPLIKFLKPVAYFVGPTAGFWTRVYFLLVIVWTLAVWSLFGAAITRMAAVEIARREKVSMVDAVKFAYRRWLSYFSAPIFPLIFIAILVVLMILFGLFSLVPALGELVNGGLWILSLILGLLMAIVLIGLVGWPLMSATVSAEGTDAWEAVSRSYSYIFQAPWHYLWYGLVAVVYGIVLVFFVGLVGSLTVYLSRWGFSQDPAFKWENREPSFMFVYSPTSFGWRELLLTGGQSDDQKLVDNGAINQEAYEKYVDSMHWNNHMGAYLVSFWIYLFFLMIVGFGYSYFWVASTITYFLMRKKVDDAELDEVYLEEEEHESFFAPTKPAEAAKPGPQMVDAPSLRVTPPPPASPPPAGTTSPPPAGGSEPSSGTPPPPTPPGGDGNANKT